ncbi:pyridoxamine 5'-phosphate oxidase family protein [Dokdonella sp. MW10]|uniref:pyridoxamine 5'-phosphate oxidase family protein n=1 Tax=Dokdonella sp. MW10 TaxID=2992926 RepID=UPI003F80703F
MSTFIDDVAALQACVGALPGPRDLKVIDFLDEHALRWLAASPLAFVTFGDRDGLAVTVAGGERGFVGIDDPRRVSLPRASLDDSADVRIGQGVGSLFLVPGLGETLRVNGRVTSIDDTRVGIAVEECYLHCAKALIRSAFWSAQPDRGDVPMPPRALAQASRLMLLATVDAEGRADLSPKGDPAGLLLQVEDGAAWYPDRPGNRRVDSFRNIIAQPRIAAIALVPGSTRVVHLVGCARVSTDAAMCERFAVDGRVPKLVTRIDELVWRVEDSAALRRVQPWPAASAPPDLDPAAIFKAHVKLSREGGLQAALVRAAVSIPGLMRRGLASDYAKNLY